MVIEITHKNGHITRIDDTAVLSGEQLKKHLARHGITRGQKTKQFERGET